MKLTSRPPREVEHVDWLGQLDRLAIGALIAAGIVGVMLVMRWIGHWILSGEPEAWGWKGIIGRVLAKTSIFFMVAAAVDIVCNYAAIPTRLASARQHLLSSPLRCRWLSGRGKSSLA
jgi:hypothetical protein